MKIRFVPAHAVSMTVFFFGNRASADRIADSQAFNDTINTCVATEKAFSREAFHLNGVIVRNSQEYNRIDGSITYNSAMVWQSPRF